MSKKSLLLLLLPLSALILYTQTTTRKENNIPPPPPLSPTPNQPIESTLKFMPSEIYTNPGQTSQLNIQLTSQGKQPTLLQLELAYDPAALSEISITPNVSNADILLNNNDEKTGRISYAINIPTNVKPPSFSEIPVILKFKVRNYTTQNQTTLFFLPKTAVLSKNTNIPIKIAYGAKILISSPAAQLKNP